MDNLGADDALRQNIGALEALAKPNGKRPLPEEYLDADYIQNHLKKFDDGIGRVSTRASFEELSFPDFTFDANEKDKCINYPTYKNKNYIDEGAPWVSVFENTPIQVSANVVPSSTVGKISIESDINAIIKNNSSNPALIQLQSTHPLNYFVLAKDTINKNEIIGGLNVISQSVSNKKNHIVKIYKIKTPSDGEYPKINVETITNKLNAIYSVCGANFIVSALTYDLSYNLDTNSNGYLDIYDILERKLLIEMVNSLVKNNEISVFVLNNKIYAKDSDNNIKEVNGFAVSNSKYPALMSKPYVVLTKQNTQIDETLAHEIGHCVFGLKHPFDEFADKGQVRGQDPKNIMDYNRAYGYCGLRAYQILEINQYKILRKWLDE